jgi:hypothetical protein
MTLGAKRFYSLASGFVHGFKWATDYIRDDMDLLRMTADGFAAAVLMTECAVALHESQAIGSPARMASRARNYPSGVAATVAAWAERYRQ